LLLHANRLFFAAKLEPVGWAGCYYAVQLERLVRLFPHAAITTARHPGRMLFWNVASNDA
jgi:hypothetical protein